MEAAADGGAGAVLSTLLGAFEPAVFLTDEVGRVLAVNGRFCELVGRETADVVGREQPYPWWPEDQHRWFVAQLGFRLESAAERGKFEGEHVAADGRRLRVTGSVSRLVGTGGGLARLVWVHRDVSKIERARRTTTDEPVDATPSVDLELALRRLFESNIIGIVTGERERILTANDAFLEIVGYDRSEYEADGIDWPAITPPEWLELDAHAGEQMLRTGRSDPIEKEYLRRDGTRARVRVAGAVVEFEPFRWVSFVEDITDVARQTERLRAANEQLNVLFGMASHDLRNPVMVIGAYSELLSKHLGSQLVEGDARLLERIRRASQDLSALVDDLLSLSQAEHRRLTLDPHRCGLSAVVTSTVELMSPLAEQKGITIVTELDDGLWAMIDEEKIRHVLTNLLSNAIKFSPEGAGVVVRSSRAGRSLAVEVTDHGQGIPVAERARLFEPFARTSVRPTGDEPSTGLGLAIVQRIVEAHGGHVEVDSVLGAGSTFRVLLPAVSAPPAA
jgi:PAS domain S-box-containing protein